MEGFNGKRVLIAGLGMSGTAAFDALRRAGTDLEVYDDRDIRKDDPLLYKKLAGTGAGCYLGGVPVPDADRDYIIMSPGVPLSLPFVEKSRDRGADIIGELELAWRLGHGRFIAITGTNGKTTTTTLVGEIFAAAGLKTVVAGNIGVPVVSKAIDADDDTWLVTEVSSFQLETVCGFRPEIAAILNLTPDHLDRHKTMENYAEAKARVFENQQKGDVLVVNADDALVMGLAGSARPTKILFSGKSELEYGAYVKDGRIIYAEPGRTPVSVIATGELRIPGKHNLENALAAVCIAFSAGIDPGITTKTLAGFKGVEHRIEFVAEVDGVRYVNDSKGTNPDAGIKAIEAIGKNILLIAGGYDKDADFTEYISAAKGRAKKLLLLGATAAKLRDSALAGGFSGEDVLMAGNIKKAVAIAKELAKPGDVVLLSPACASWDMYENYEERGRDFTARVKELEVRK